MKRFEARQRVALDGKIWWCIYDIINHKWSTLINHGKYKTKKEAEYVINRSDVY